MASKLVGFFWNKIVATNDKKRMAKQQKPSGVGEICDIAYNEDCNKHHLLDIYRKAGDTKKLPTIIDIHGGGWYYGDKELNKNYAMTLAKGGFAVVCISYRLAPNTKCSQQIKDCADAVNFVFDNAEKYNLDKNNIFITGDSAGGHLSAMMTNLVSSERAQRYFGIKLKGKFNAVCYTCPCLELATLALKRMIGIYCNPMFDRGYRKDKELANYNFSTNLDGNKCPSFFISAYADMMKNQTKKGYELVKSKGIPVAMSFLDKPLIDGHKLTHVFNVLYPEWEESAIVNNEMLDFFKQYLTK